jgi:hypothetical protein
MPIDFGCPKKEMTSLRHSDTVNKKTDVRSGPEHVIASLRGKVFGPSLGRKIAPSVPDRFRFNERCLS